MQQTETHITQPFPKQDRAGEQYFVVIEQLLTPDDRPVVRVRSYRQTRFHGPYGTVVTGAEGTGEQVYQFPSPRPPEVWGRPLVGQWATKEVHGIKIAKCRPNPNAETYQDWLAWSEAFHRVYAAS